MRHLVLALVAASLTACRGDFRRPTEPVDLLRQLGPGVHAQMVDGGVRVLNATSGEIRLVVVNPYWLGLVAGCSTSTSGCVTLRPNAEQVVPNSQIHGIEDQPTELVVRYWRSGDEYPTEISVMRRALAQLAR